MIRNRALPERAYLTYHFNLNTNGDTYLVKLPFYENAMISESQRSNVNRMSPIGRSSNIFTYTGSESRRLNIRFYITLPHLYESIIDTTSEMYQDGIISTSVNERSKFTRLPSEAAPDAETRTIRRIERLYTVFKAIVPEADPNFGPGLQFVQDLLDNVNIFKYLVEDRTPEDPLTKKKVQAIYLFWINLIRSSVITNKDAPYLGPPILYLSYGAMYQDTPFICTDYQISPDEQAGFEVKTLLPRRIQVTMSLEEIRMGTYGKFLPGAFKGGDNNYGWEDILFWGTTDANKHGYLDALNTDKVT
jgi:hypothetical protein